MKVKGRYYTDQNFVTVCANNTVYTKAKNSGEWGSVKVGDRTFAGWKFEQEDYDQELAKCDKEGVFDVPV